MSNTPKPLPDIRSLEESRTECHNYGAVLTAGPSLEEVSDFGHPSHKVFEFKDTDWGPLAPKLSDVVGMLEWGTGKDSLLVHCHAGISRSTATAWGIAISNGWDPEEALGQLIAKHPLDYYRITVPADNRTERLRRPFSPNPLIVQHLESIFGFRNGELRDLRDQMATGGIW